MRIHTVVATVLLVFASVCAAGEAPLADRLPAGTLLYVGWGGRSLAFDGSMFGQLTRDPGVKELAGAMQTLVRGEAPPSSRGMIEAAWDLGAISWQHPMAIALTDIRTPENGPEAVVLVETGKDREEFEKHVAKLLAGLRGADGPPEKKLTLGSVTYSQMQAAPDQTISWGYIETLFFLCLGERTPEQIINLAEGKTLKANAGFAAAYKQVSGETNQLAVYIDTDALRKKLLAGMEAEEELAKEELAEANRALDSLGLGGVSCMVGCVQIVDRGMLTKVRVRTPAPHRGVLMPLAGAKVTEADLADVPADADFVLAVKLSPQAAYAELRRVLKQIDPALDAEFQEGLAAAESELKVSVYKDLLAPLGDSWVLSSAPSQGGFLTGTVLSVSVKDADALGKALKKLEEYAAEQSGGHVTFKTVKAGRADVRYAAVAPRSPWDTPIPVAPAWSVHKGRLYLAAWPQVVVSTIENGNGNGGENTARNEKLLKDETFLSLRKRVSAEASIVAYLNTPSLTRQLYNMQLIGGTMGLGQVFRGAEFRPMWPLPLSRLEKYTWPEINAVSSDKDGILFEAYGSGPSLGSILPGMALGGAAAIAPVVVEARAKAKQTVSMSNLNGISKAMMVYAVERAGETPDSFAPLIEMGFISPRFLVSPVSGRKPPRMKDGEIVGEVDYVLVEGMSSSAPVSMVWAYERPENYQRKGTLVLFCDGAVRWLEMAAFEKALNATREYVKKGDGKEAF